VRGPRSLAARSAQRRLPVKPAGRTRRSNQVKEDYLKKVPMANRQQTYDAIRQLVASLDDPFTRFLEPERLAALRRGTKGGSAPRRRRRRPAKGRGRGTKEAAGGGPAVYKLEPAARPRAPRRPAPPSPVAPGSVTGIGAEVTLVDAKGGGSELAVVTPAPGGPADRAGIRPGDVIESVGGAPTRGLSLYEASELLQGEDGSEVGRQLWRGRGLL
jgi:carboxyl-terminal processing protease